MDNTNLPEGVDGAELHTTQEIRDVAIEHNGKVWRFKFKELGWKEKMELVSEMQEQQTNQRNGITTTSVKYWKYLTTVYTRCVVSAPEGFRFDKCSSEFGQKLVDAMPGITDMANPEEPKEDELKN